MIENEIYCYINGLLKRNIRKKTSYIIGNKKFYGKIYINVRIFFIKKKSKKFNESCSFYNFFVFAFLLFLLSLTLIIGIFYCLNYSSLLPHLITAHLVSHLSLSSVIFSISPLIIGIFYSLDCISLLLHLIIIQLVIDFIITK